MPNPDPVPAGRFPPSVRRSFVRVIRMAAVLSIVIATIAVLLVARGQSERHIPMLIATALSVGLSVLLASGLMTLIFSSHRSGHDANAAAPPIESVDQ